jgi:hypothetical protein
MRNFRYAQHQPLALQYIDQARNATIDVANSTTRFSTSCSGSAAASGFQVDAGTQDAGRLRAAGWMFP